MSSKILNVVKLNTIRNPEFCHFRTHHKAWRWSNLTNPIRFDNGHLESEAALSLPWKITDNNENLVMHSLYWNPLAVTLFPRGLLHGQFAQLETEHISPSMNDNRAILDGSP